MSSDTRGFTRFRNQVSQRTEWPSEFVRVLSLTLVDEGLGPGELSRRLGNYPEITWQWFAKGRLPRRETVSRIENILGKSEGYLEQHIPENARKERSGKAMTRRWQNRRKNYTTEEYRQKYMAGDFHGGAKPWEHLSSSRSPGRVKPPIPMQIRIRMGVFKISGRHGVQGNTFVLCARCAKAVCRINYALRFNNYFHGACWDEFKREDGQVRLKDKRLRRGRRSPSTLDLLIRYWLESNILGLSYGQIAERHSEDGYSYKDISKMVKRAEDWLPKRWGQLIRSGKKSSINGLLSDFTLEEVTQIAQGNHILSNATVDADVLNWEHPDKPTPYRWSPGELTDTPLAALLAGCISGKYSTQTTASKAVGIHAATLFSILYSEPVFLQERTWNALSSYLDMPVADLKALSPVKLNRATASPPNKAKAEIKELRAKLAQLEAVVAEAD